MEHFAQLTPNRFLPALEEAIGTELTALARPLPSYINRVYDLQARDGTPYVAKFYRPGRWPRQAIVDEHTFMADCAEVDIPVVCPLTLQTGGTLGQLDTILFAVFPKRSGRHYDVESEESWQRVGTLLGRVHNAGRKRNAPARLTLTPQETTARHVEQLAGEAVVEKWRQSYKDICARIIDTVAPCFEGLERIRIHGDFHCGNILDRPDEGLMVIDFDDMMNGPPAQDFWLLLPEHYPASEPQLRLLLRGYRQFRDIAPPVPLLIEGLRAMRMVYFTAWCNTQRDDFQFRNKYPDWGSESFWAREVQDLRTQFATMMDAMAF
jgi:Ser/Thr protein kinase RdoA (MazF antagonist)